MKIWELRYENVNKFAVLTPVDDFDLLSVFSTDGKEKFWDSRPRVAPSKNKRTKKPDPRSDLTYLIAGSIVINKKAYYVLKDYLLRFGQLLELDCAGETEYFYNVTNIINCIDYDSSAKEFDVVSKEVFYPDAVPENGPLIFKDPHTAGLSIYLNQAGKEKFEELANAAKLCGVRFVEAGQGLL